MLSFRGVGERFGVSRVVGGGSNFRFGGPPVVLGLRLGVSSWPGRSLLSFFGGLRGYPVRKGWQ